MEDVKKLLGEITADAQARLGDALMSFYVYGSAARGGMNEWSGIDICLICNSDEKRKMCANWVKGTLPALWCAEHDAGGGRCSCQSYTAISASPIPQFC